jgi:hypothetical protein
MAVRPAMTNEAARAEAIAAYKSILKEILDRRPSGTRHRLSQALGKARSFISQISNPVYTIAIPRQHLSVIFEVCHFSAAEMKRFLALYAEAHPGRPVSIENLPRLRTLHVPVPDLGDDRHNEEFDKLIHDFVDGLAKVARNASKGTSEKGSKS